MSTNSRSRKRVVIIGASDTGLALVRTLSAAWEVALLDINAERLAALRGTLPAETAVTLFEKDGTSLLNLREAGVVGAEWVIAATDRDEVNVEACRVALTVERPPRAVAVVQTAEAQRQLKELGAEALLRPAAAAGLVLNVIESGMRFAAGIGLGRGEVVEIPILPTSPTVNVRIADLRARRWLVAAIYRQDQIIIPHGDAIVRAGDRLLLSGEPDILPDIAEYLRAGVARFPRQYGQYLVALDDGKLSPGFWHELQHLATQVRISELSALAAEGAEVSHPPAESGMAPPTLLRYRKPLGPYLMRERTQLDCACLVIPKPQAGWMRRLGLRKPAWAPILDALTCPLLLAAGHAPYTRVVLAASQSADLPQATALAIDVARQLGLPLLAVTVSAPDFVSGSEEVAANEQVLKVVREIAAQYRVDVEPHHLDGNPVREVARFVAPDDLLVLTNRPRRRASLFSPDIGALLIEHTPCSVLALCVRPFVRTEGVR